MSGMTEIRVTNRDGEVLNLEVHPESNLDEMFGHFKTILIWLTYHVGNIGEIDD